MENTKCEGACKEHKGSVKKVKVYGGFLNVAWFFNYCECAIEEDERGGFTVEILPDEPGPPNQQPISKMAHTNEPWRLELDPHNLDGANNSGYIYVYGADLNCILGINCTHVGTKMFEVDKANARRIVAAVNACAGIEIETLESGAPGWVAEKLASCKPENPFLDALLDTTNECIKSQLASDFKAIELQKQLYAANAENERLQNTMDSANKLNDLLVKELKSVKLKLYELDAKHLETLNELEDAKEMMFDRRDEY